MRVSGLISVGFVAAFSLFNLQPYVGLRYGGCQTMYSGLSPLPPGNHWFLPRLRWFDNGDYLVNARIAGGAVHPYLNLEFARRQLQESCARGAPLSLSFDEGGRTKRIEDACADAEYSRPKHGVWLAFGYPASLGDAE